jgi:hypothetical protein
VWKDDDCIEIDPTEWLRTVLYVTTRTKGGMGGIQATDIYDIAGPSLRKAGITNVLTCVITIHPGRYNRRKGRTPMTQYAASTLAMTATTDWLEIIENRKAQTEHIQAKRNQERIRTQDKTRDKTGRDQRRRRPGGGRPTERNRTEQDDRTGTDPSEQIQAGQGPYVMG